MKRIAILASGTGSNARQIITHLENNTDMEVALVASNRVDAKVLDMAADHSIPTAIITKSSLYESDEFLELLSDQNIDWIVLAGFLWLIPKKLTAIYTNKIVNIHPSLLPKYGGKGMYGIHVHKAVKAAKETQSGMTIHLVNEKYDDGAIVFQARVDLDPNDEADDIAKKVLEIEHKYYPIVVEGLVNAQG